MALIEILTGLATDPIAYSMVFFIYAVLAAVILPIPVEIGLFNHHIHPVVLVSILAIGKGVGALIVFQISTATRKKLKKYTSTENRFIKKLIDYSEWFVKKYGYFGLLIILSTPLMIDSISLYLFSLLNPEERGKGMDREWFTLVNIIAGAIRGTITLVVFYQLGVKLV